MDFQFYLDKAGVPEHMHAQALECLKRAKRKAILPAVAGLFAPIVVLFLILTRQLKWEDNNVPKWAWWYDNNISINGDGWGMLYPDGRCVNRVDMEVVNRGEAIALHYGDPRYTGDAYYSEGNHPRSWRARWTWLGFRNRASALAMHQGEQIDLKETPQWWGMENPNREVEGYRFMYCTGLWQFYQTRRVFFGKLAMTRNCGFKIGNAFTEQNPTAMCIYYQAAFKPWKGK